jgi:hypothetical protein
MKHNRVPVTSSRIVSVGYEADTRKLQVEFKGGRVYEYADVPPEIYTRLLEANADKDQSLGIHFHKLVKKPGYVYTRLADEVSDDERSDAPEVDARRVVNASLTPTPDCEE